MTREKRELLIQLEQIDIQEDLVLSIGPLSPRALEALEEEVGNLKRPILERLNTLMHGRVNDYFCACVL